MSWQATTWAIRQTTGSPGAKIVLLLLADHASNNEDGHHACYHSQQRLADESEQSVSTVARQLKALEDKGLILRQKRGSTDGGRTTDRIVLMVSEVTGQSDRKPPEPEGVNRQPGGVNRQNDGGVIRQIDGGYPSPVTEEAYEALIEEDIGPRVRAPKPPRRATQLPADWSPTDQHTAFAKANDLDLVHERDQFMDHHTAKGSTFKNWNAAFNTWLRNQAKWNRERHGNVRPLRPDPRTAYTDANGNLVLPPLPKGVFDR